MTSRCVEMKVHDRIIHEKQFGRKNIIFRDEIWFSKKNIDNFYEKYCFSKNLRFWKFWNFQIFENLRFRKFSKFEIFKILKFKKIEIFFCQIFFWKSNFVMKNYYFSSRFFFLERYDHLLSSISGVPTIQDRDVCYCDDWLGIVMIVPREHIGFHYSAAVDRIL